MEERNELTTADLAGRGEGAADDDGDQASPQLSRDGDVEVPLLGSDESERYHERWQSIQADFVDRPREAVEEADRLVADLMQRLTGQFSETRTNLEQQWDRDDDVSTEDLRVALTRYRSFFERLLTA
jgi:hypothetical protein